MATVTELLTAQRRIWAQCEVDTIDRPSESDAIMNAAGDRDRELRSRLCQTAPSDMTEAWKLLRFVCDDMEQWENDDPWLAMIQQVRDFLHGKMCAELPRRAA